jgi:hypothetical protein
MCYFRIMTLAKDINNSLDTMLFLEAEIKRVEELTAEQVADMQMECDTDDAQAVLIQGLRMVRDECKKKLNQITNNGLNVKEIFTNKFYITDLNQKETDEYAMREWISHQMLKKTKENLQSE